MKVNCTENVQAKTMTERRQTSTKQQKKSKDEKRVKFHQDIVFNEMIKDGESAEILNFLRRKSVDIDVNERNEHGRTALKNLIMNDNLKCVKVLVQQGADVNKEDENGQTPMHYACQSGSLSMTKFLLESHADPDVTDLMGLRPIDYTDDFEMLELIMKFSTKEWGC